jgi:hypothetical protein
MTFGDWIDIFTFKKNVSELLFKYNDDNNNGIDAKRIEENIIGVDSLLKEIENLLLIMMFMTQEIVIIIINLE